jgi:hypothetical protein
VPPASPPQQAEDQTESLVTSQMVEKYVLKDADVKGLLAEIDRANQYMAKLRIVADKPEAMPEFQDYVAIVKELNHKLDERKNELRPLIKKRLVEVYSEINRKRS